MVKLTEMFKLGIGLEARGIEIEVVSLYNGLQIRCEGWDAICHDYSDGHERNLLDVWGLPQCGDDIIGGLTAEEVLKMVDEVNGN